MDIFFIIILVLHILGGSIGLITGTINIARRKGDRIHKKTGKVFLFSMLTTGFSALILSVLHPNFFLFIVGVFTLYLTATGKRSLFFNRKINQSPQAIDWFMTITMLLASIVFFVLGALKVYQGNTFAVTLIVFGFF